MDKGNTTASLKLDDIYFVLFRHKWKIVVCLLLGICGAAAVWKWMPQLYRSDAKLLVRYIVQSTPTLQPGSDQQIQVVDGRGDSVLNTELEILSSADLARSVAERVGPARILPAGDYRDPLSAATGFIVKHTHLAVQGRSSVIQIGFTHEDPGICREVLGALIDAYLTLHTEMRLSGETYDLMAAEAEQRRESLRQTEQRLQQLREKTGGVSLEEAKRTVASEIDTLRKAILEAESDLAGKQAMLEVLRPAATATAHESNGSLVAAPTPSGAGTIGDQVAYQALLSQLRDFRAREQDYLARFTDENPLVVNVRRQIQQAEAKLERFLAENPGIEYSNTPTESASGTRTDEPEVTAALVASLKAKLNTLRDQLEKARGESLTLSELENEISEVQLAREIQEGSLRYLVTALEQTRYDSALQAGRHSSINILQEPTVPGVDGDKAKKLAVLVLGGFSGAGIGLAFLLELFLDPRVKRSSQLARGLNLPVYATIPASPTRRRLTGPAGRTSKVRHAASAKDPDGELGAVELAAPVTSVVSNGRRSHYEALRDRLILYFERVNLRRKPKLVGVTACHGQAGVSSIAEGLAATLSETGGGKVLLVDLNVGKGSVQPYHMGRPAVSLPDLLQDSKPVQPGEVQDSLMLASLQESGRGYHPIRSREFDALIPKLKASDFDYVVFDMPPLNATSVSFRLAGFLDKVLVVGEAERTHMESLRSAIALLQESNSKVALIMNKAREYVPPWLRPPE